MSKEQRAVVGEALRVASALLPPRGAAVDDWPSASLAVVCVGEFVNPRHPVGRATAAL